MARSRKSPAEVIRSRDFSARGVPRETLRRLTRKGVFERAARGVYLTPAAAQSAHRDLLVAAVRVPNGILCLLTALAFH